MNKNWKMFKSEQEWEKCGSPRESYYELDSLETGFKIKCDKCGNEAKLFCEYEFDYSVQHILRCENCNIEYEIYGCDG